MAEVRKKKSVSYDTNPVEYAAQRASVASSVYSTHNTTNGVDLPSTSGYTDNSDRNTSMRSSKSTASNRSSSSRQHYLSDNQQPSEAAVYAQKLRYGVYDSPGFPSVGVEKSSSNSAANLAVDSNLSPNLWTPNKSAAAGAAAVLAKQNKGPDVWKPSKSSVAGAAALASKPGNVEPLYVENPETRKSGLQAAQAMHKRTSTGLSASAAAATLKQEQQSNSALIAAQAIPKSKDPQAQPRSSDMDFSYLRTTTMSAPTQPSRNPNKPGPFVSPNETSNKFQSADLGSINLAGIEASARKAAEKRLSSIYMANPKSSGTGVGFASSGAIASTLPLDPADMPHTYFSEEERRTLKERSAFLKDTQGHANLHAIASERARQSLAAVEAEHKTRVPHINPEYYREALQVAESKYAKRTEHHGKIDLGGGAYMTQADIDAIAARHVKPVLKEIDEKATALRAKDEQQRLEDEETKRKYEAAKAEQRRQKQAEKEARAAAKEQRRKEEREAKLEEARIRAANKPPKADKSDWANKIVQKPKNYAAAFTAAVASRAHGIAGSGSGAGDAEAHGSAVSKSYGEGAATEYDSDDEYEEVEDDSPDAPLFEGVHGEALANLSVAHHAKIVSERMTRFRAGEPLDVVKPKKTKRVKKERSDVVAAPAIADSDVIESTPAGKFDHCTSTEAVALLSTAHNARRAAQHVSGENVSTGEPEETAEEAPVAKPTEETTEEPAEEPSEETAEEPVEEPVPTKVPSTTAAAAAIPVVAAPIVTGQTKKSTTSEAPSKKESSTKPVKGEKKKSGFRAFIRNLTSSDSKKTTTSKPVSKSTQESVNPAAAAAAAASSGAPNEGENKFYDSKKSTPAVASSSEQPAEKPSGAAAAIPGAGVGAAAAAEFDKFADDDQENVPAGETAEGEAKFSPEDQPEAVEVANPEVVTDKEDLVEEKETEAASTEGETVEKADGSYNLAEGEITEPKDKVSTAGIELPGTTEKAEPEIENEGDDDDEAAAEEEHDGAEQEESAPTATGSEAPVLSAAERKKKKNQKKKNKKKNTTNEGMFKEDFANSPSTADSPDWAAEAESALKHVQGEIEGAVNEALKQ